MKCKFTYQHRNIVNDPNHRFLISLCLSWCIVPLLLFSSTDQFTFLIVNRPRLSSFTYNLSATLKWTFAIHILRLTEPKHNMQKYLYSKKYRHSYQHSFKVTAPLSIGSIKPKLRVFTRAHRSFKTRINICIVHTNAGKNIKFVDLENCIENTKSFAITFHVQ